MRFTVLATLHLVLALHAACNSDEWRPVTEEHPLMGEWKVLTLKDELSVTTPTHASMIVGSGSKLIQTDSAEWQLEVRGNDQIRLTSERTTPEGVMTTTAHGRYRIVGGRLEMCLSDADEQGPGNTYEIRCGPYTPRLGVPKKYSTKFGDLLTAKKKSSAESVSVTSFGSDNVIGLLGQPLGTVVRIQGISVDGNSTRRKADSTKTLLKISSVNGKNLDCPVLLPFERAASDMSPPVVGKTFDYYAHEWGSFDGVARIPKGIPVKSPMVAHDGFHFRHHITIHAVTETDSDSDAAAEQMDERESDMPSGS